jgi:hypothetical protein
MLTLGSNDRFLFDRNGAAADAAGSENSGGMTMVVGWRRVFCSCVGFELDLPDPDALGN